MQKLGTFYYGMPAPDNVNASVIFSPMPDRYRLTRQLNEMLTFSWFICFNTWISRYVRFA